MTWPRQYGGAARGALERYVVIEEMLAAGAPVGAHWMADRQVGPLILNCGTEAQRAELLPAMARGECCVAVGMSEPGAGSDLAAVSTRAHDVEDGFRLSGAKIWTTHAHHASYVIVLCRTDAGDRHTGLSQLLVPTDTPGITIRPIIDMTGSHHFNEVTFENVFVPQTAVIGERGRGWAQVLQELAHERSGPERFLSSFPTLSLLAKSVAREPSDEAVTAVGRLVSQLVILRRLSMSVAELLARGENPMLQAAIVKDLGAAFEQRIPEVARQLVAMQPSLDAADDLHVAVAVSLLNAPAFSLRGGTREILRGVIGRGLLGPA